MSKLYTLLVLDSMILEILDIPNIIKFGSGLDINNFYKKQMQHIKYIYFAPSFNGKTRRIFSNYASVIVNFSQMPNGEYFENYRNSKAFFDSYSINSQNVDDSQKIAYFISNSCLRFDNNLINTEDRIIMWLLQKDHAFRLASCFLMQDRLLQEDCNKGILDDLQVKALYKEFEIYSNFYKIIDYKWKKIQARFKNYKDFSFTSSLELFLEIIKTELDNNYQPFLKPRTVNKKKKNRQNNQVAQDILSNSKVSPQKIKEFEKSKSQHDRANFWFNEIQKFFLEEADKDRAIKKHISTVNNLVKRQLEIIQNKRFKKHPDYTILYGLMYPGDVQKTTRGEIRKARNTNKTSTV